jgi:plasmid stability protein
MRTTIDLPDELFRRLKARAALDGRKLKDVLTEFVEQGLEAAPAPDFRELRRRTPLPVIPATGKPLPALSNEELALAEEEEDLASLRSAGC